MVLLRKTLAIWVSLIFVLGLDHTTTYANTINVDGVCNLVDAIIAANMDMATGSCPAGSGTDTLILDTNVNLTTVYASSTDTSGGRAGLPDITTNITIQAGLGNTISGNNTTFRIFNVISGGSLTLTGITVSGGRLAPTTGFAAFGGGIIVFTGANLVLNGTTITGNSLRAPDNTASFQSNASGGGIFIQGGGGATITNSAIINNSAVSGNRTSGSNPGGRASAGGFRQLGGTVTITNSLIANNTVQGGDAPGAGGQIEGAGIQVAGISVILNTTISGNSGIAGNSTGGGAGGGAYGGGIQTQFGTGIELRNTTIANNFIQSGVGGTTGSAQGGGFHDLVGTTPSLFSTLIGDNQVQAGGGMPIADDCANEGTITSLGYNWVEVPMNCVFSNTGDQTGSDAQLMALANNGGGTSTHALAPTSPAIDQGSCNSGAVNSDQRGFSRPVDSPVHANAIDGCDVGAYERDFFPPTATPTATVTPSDTPTFTPTNTACVLIATAPVLISPAHRSHTPDTTPTFTWTAVSGAQSFRLMIYLEDRSFVYKKRTFATSYTLLNSYALIPARYLWRVRTQDSTCSTWSAWSKRNTLFVD